MFHIVNLRYAIISNLLKELEVKIHQYNFLRKVLKQYHVCFEEKEVKISLLKVIAFAVWKF